MSTRFGRFLLVGGVCTLLNLAVQWLATGWLGLHYLTGVTISFVAVNFFGFMLNKLYTFKNTEPQSLQQATRYYAIMALSFGANLVCMVILVDGAGIHYLLASLMVTVTFVAVNFIGHAAWTFAPLNRP
ncbi:MAG TPA: GtrA family protein [Nevskiales bacterium]|nr:GtrA family protein [Nevskiales bacterium]